MNKIICLFAGLAVTALALADSQWENASVEFYSNGPDLYRDGTPVLDGECYALVWVPNGAEVPNCSADGKLLSSDGCKILTAGPWADNKGCGKMVTVEGVAVRSPMSHKLTVAQRDALVKGGTFRLCLLDSRKADGSLAARTVVEGEYGAYSFPTTVNGFVTTAELTGEAAAIATTVGISSPIRIASASVVPEGTQPPKIVGMRMRGEGASRVMEIEVECTYDYLQYTVAGGATPDAVGATAATGATAADGNPTKRIVITVPATGDSNFYRVIRK